MESHNDNLYAGIDIGSNTIRLTLGHVEDNSLNTLTRELEITRLGEDFHRLMKVSDSAWNRSLAVLKRYSEIIKENNITKIRAVATGVMRKAQNAAEFIDDVFNKTGIKIDVISGEKEAELTALGVKSAVKTDNSIIFDVGGGSTEFIFDDNTGKVAVMSIDIGAVTLYESYIRSDPPGGEELIALNLSIQDQLGAVVKVERFCDCSDVTSEIPLIFTAGTATTLAAMKLEMKDYDAERINGATLTYRDVKGIYEGLIVKSSKERMEIKGLEKGREDIIISGCMIALNVMDIFRKDDMTISDAGLLEGIILDLGRT